VSSSELTRIMVCKYLVMGSVLRSACSWRRGNRVELCDHQDYLNRLIPQSETPALKRGEVRRNYSLGREDGIDLPQ
jgi:hypothetical protein